MTNKFYVPGEQRGVGVQKLFNRIASRYDLINDLQSFGLHRHWKSRVIELARPDTDDRALDICCGTGDIALMLEQRSSVVVGVDFSDRMLEVAQRRKSRFRRTAQTTPNRPGSTLHFIQGNALRMPFPDKSFDIVTVAYGLRNLADVNSGLREMCRVTKPGGRLLVLDFGKPDNAIWRSFYFAYLKVFVPVLGFIFCGSASAYAYILESLKHYPAQQGVAAQMKELGLVNVRIVNLLGGVMSINYAEKKP